MNSEQLIAELKKSVTDVYAGAVKPFFKFVVVAFGIVAIVLVVIYFLVPTSTQIQWVYHLDPKDVEVAKQLHDCDFMTAPMGDKNCRYEREIVFFDASGNGIGGDFIESNGHHIKTEPKDKVASARIDWVKVME